MNCHFCRDTKEVWNGEKATMPCPRCVHVSVAFNRQTGGTVVTPDPCHDRKLIRKEFAESSAQLIIARARFSRAAKAMRSL